MRIKNSKIIIILLLITMSLMVFSPDVHGQETESLELSVTLSLSGAPPTDDEDYEIIFEADNPDYPMPEGSVNGVYVISVAGQDSITLPEIRYSSIGIYTYTMYQQEGDNELVDYDDTEYTLVVYVTNTEDGSGLESMVLLYLEGEPGKIDEIVFDSVYEEEPEDEEDPDPLPPQDPKPPQTSDDTVIWPYVGLFISGAAMLSILGMTVIKKKIED